MPAKYELLPTSPRASSPLPPYTSSSSRSPSRSNSLTSTGSSSPPPYNPSLSTPYPPDTPSGYSLTSPLDLDEDDPENVSTFYTNPRTRDTRECIRAFHADPRFNPPPPSPVARIALVVFTIGLFWVAWLTRRAIWIDYGAGMGEPGKPNPNLGVY